MIGHKRRHTVAGRIRGNTVDSDNELDENNIYDTEEDSSQANTTFDSRSTLADVETDANEMYSEDDIFFGGDEISAEELSVMARLQRIEKVTPLLQRWWRGVLRNRRRDNLSNNALESNETAHDELITRRVESVQPSNSSSPLSVGLQDSHTENPDLSKPEVLQAEPAADEGVIDNDQIDVSSKTNEVSPPSIVVNSSKASTSRVGTNKKLASQSAKVVVKNVVSRLTAKTKTAAKPSECISNPLPVSRKRNIIPSGKDSHDRKKIAIDREKWVEKRPANKLDSSQVKTAPEPKIAKLKETVTLRKPLVSTSKSKKPVSEKDASLSKDNSTTNRLVNISKSDDNVADISKAKHSESNPPQKITTKRLISSKSVNTQPRRPVNGVSAPKTQPESSASRAIPSKSLVKTSGASKVTDIKPNSKTSTTLQGSQKAIPTHKSESRPTLSSKFQNPPPNITLRKPVSVSKNANRISSSTKTPHSRELSTSSNSGKSGIKPPIESKLQKPDSGFKPNMQFSHTSKIPKPGEIYAATTLIAADSSKGSTSALLVDEDGYADEKTRSLSKMATSSQDSTNQEKIETSLEESNLSENMVISEGVGMNTDQSPVDLSLDSQPELAIESVISEFSTVEVEVQRNEESNSQPEVSKTCHMVVQDIEENEKIFGHSISFEEQANTHENVVINDRSGLVTALESTNSECQANSQEDNQCNGGFIGDLVDSKDTPGTQDHVGVSIDVNILEDQTELQGCAYPIADLGVSVDQNHPREENVHASDNTGIDADILKDQLQAQDHESINVHPEASVDQIDSQEENIQDEQSAEIGANIPDNQTESNISVDADSLIDQVDFQDDVNASIDAEIPKDQPVAQDRESIDVHPEILVDKNDSPEANTQDNQSTKAEADIFEDKVNSLHYADICADTDTSIDLCDPQEQDSTSHESVSNSTEIIKDQRHTQSVENAGNASDAFEKCNLQEEATRVQEENIDKVSETLTKSQSMRDDGEIAGNPFPSEDQIVARIDSQHHEETADNLDVTQDQNNALKGERNEGATGKAGDLEALPDYVTLTDSTEALSCHISSQENIQYNQRSTNQTSETSSDLQGVIQDFQESDGALVVSECKNDLQKDTTGDSGIVLNVTTLEMQIDDREMDEQDSEEVTTTLEFTTSSQEEEAHSNGNTYDNLMNSEIPTSFHESSSTIDGKNVNNLTAMNTEFNTQNDGLQKDEKITKDLMAQVGIEDEVTTSSMSLETHTETGGVETVSYKDALTEKMENEGVFEGFSQEFDQRVASESLNRDVAETANSRSNADFVQNAVIAQNDEADSKEIQTGVPHITSTQSSNDQFALPITADHKEHKSEVDPSEISGNRRLSIPRKRNSMLNLQDTLHQRRLSAGRRKSLDRKVGIKSGPRRILRSTVKTSPEKATHQDLTEENPQESTSNLETEGVEINAHIDLNDCTPSNQSESLPNVRRSLRSSTRSKTKVQAEPTQQTESSQITGSKSAGKRRRGRTISPEPEPESKPAEPVSEIITIEASNENPLKRKPPFSFDRPLSQVNASYVRAVTKNLTQFNSGYHLATLQLVPIRMGVPRPPSPTKKLIDRMEQKREITEIREETPPQLSQSEKPKERRRKRVNWDPLLVTIASKKSSPTKVTNNSINTPCISTVKRKYPQPLEHEVIKIQKMIWLEDEQEM